MPQDDMFSGSFSGLMGTNSLQQAIDKLTEATKGQTAAIQQNSSAQAGGMVSVPAMSQAAQGQTFSSGSFPRSNGGDLSPPYIPHGGGYSQGSYSYMGGAGSPPGQYSSSPAVQGPSAIQTFGGSNGGVPMQSGGNGGYGSTVVPTSESNYGGG